MNVVSCEFDDGEDETKMKPMEGWNYGRLKKLIDMFLVVICGYLLKFTRSDCRQILGFFDKFFSSQGSEKNLNKNCD